MELLRRDEISTQSRPYGRTVQKVLSRTFDDPIDSMAIYLSDVPNGRLDPHYHAEATEIICFPDGGRITVNGVEYAMQEWDMVLLEPGDTHGYTGEECSKTLHMAIKLPDVDDKVATDG